MASKTPPRMNPWEDRALNYQFSGHSQVSPDNGQVNKWRKLQDPMIYPGLYSASGFDLMDIMLRIIGRPNPRIELGAVDCSVSLVLCDLELPDHPIVYVSDTYCDLTGYSKSELLGRNCRFLQYPPGLKDTAPSKTAAHSKSKPSSASQMRQAIETRREIQLRVKNYKKNGKSFTNYLSIIPIELDVPGYYYAAGFLVEID
ncbi:hypothetical protein CDD82_6571 [Ophiocordyceps australis]|uniref:PAS domain-containing protein n=1 Tax=Ophiocordyceps australis TaxID=1399860 RepID=A0A2C5ZQY6_9HYPO|nr:hypothetical protein CDD82_6571 [Ophiocordyceps australis]